MLFNKIKTLAPVIGFAAIAFLALYGGLAMLSASVAPVLAEAPQGTPMLTAGDATVPPYINYQGTLRDAEGNPLSGTFDMTFRIYDDLAAPVAELWSEEHISVTVRSGHFSVLLGNTEPISPTLFSDPDRFIGVTVDPYDEMVPKQRFASVPYAMYSQNGIPVGTVLDWWRPTPDMPVPDGFMICDGSSVNDPESPINGTPLPDLTNRFVRGMTDPAQLGSDGYTSGGSDSHRHRISHDHSNATTSSRGSHSHSLPASTGSVYNGGSDPGRQAYRARDDNQGWTSNVHLAVDGGSSKDEGQHRHSLEGNTGSAGIHNHPVNIPSYSGNSYYATNIPAYVGLLKICRIK